MNAQQENGVNQIASESTTDLSQGTNHGQSIAPVADGSNLDKVRDILFGNQVREYDKKFSRLEERVIKECATVRDETRNRLDSLEKFLKNELESLSERLKHEHSTRDEAVKALAQESKEMTASLERKLSQFDEQTSNSQREVRQHILDQSKSLYDEIRQKTNEMLAALEREAQELRHDKTDRATLAALFTELAIRLNHKS